MARLARHGLIRLRNGEVIAIWWENQSYFLCILKTRQKFWELHNLSLCVHALMAAGRVAWSEVKRERERNVQCHFFFWLRLCNTYAEKQWFSLCRFNADPKFQRKKPELDFKYKKLKLHLVGGFAAHTCKIRAPRRVEWNSLRAIVWP